jgi:hypothetical protein
MVIDLKNVVLVSVLLTNPVSAAEVAGVKIDDQTRVGNAELALTGAGLRKRLFFQVYAIGLYVRDHKADPISQPGPKRVQIHMLRDVGAEQFTEALEPKVREFAAIMAEVKEAKKGMAIALDWTGSETRLLINGSPTGQPIAGEELYRALLRVWLGDKPVQDDLKKSLLGG